MKKVYLTLAVIGFIAPNILVAIESIETGNILLYTNILATVEGMFANRISTIFAIDLFFAVFIFFLWSYFDSKKLHLKKLAIVWILTMAFGLAGGLPFYLYLRERTLEETS